MIHIEPSEFRTFVRESNRIEGITRAPLQRELRAHADLIRCDAIQLGDLCRFVAAVQPGATLRDASGMNVRVGSHIAPPGGPAIRERMFELLDAVVFDADPFVTHCTYETIHPFMDGNGRSGRALWLWQMIRRKRALYALHTGFLHLFYYQALQAFGDRFGSAAATRQSGSEANTGCPQVDREGEEPQ